MKDLSGTTLGSYTLGKKIGQGGMGTVYESYQASMGRQVAIKVLLVHLADDQGYLERFNREVALAARLEHPHILPVYDYGVVDDINYIVMRLLTGGSLEDRIVKRGRPSLKEAMTALEQIASALDYAHRKGVVHRDLKPSNVLFDSEGHVYLTDFGIAKVLESATNLTGSGQLIGTPAYMSPEQWRGEAVDGRADIYAMGVMSYHLLTGRMPFDAPTPYAMMNQHLNTIPEPPASIDPALPASVNQVLSKGLAKEVEQRYATPLAFVEALGKAVKGLQIQEAESTGFLQNVTPAQLKAYSPATEILPSKTTAPHASKRRSADDPTEMMAMHEQPTGIRSRRRSSGLLLLGMVAALALVAAGIFALMSSGDEQDGRATAAVVIGGETDEPEFTLTPQATRTDSEIAVIPEETEAPEADTPTPTLTNTATGTPTQTATHTATMTRTPTPSPSHTPLLETRIAIYATQTAALFTPTDTPDIAATETIELGRFYATQTATFYTATPTLDAGATQTAEHQANATLTATYRPPTNTPGTPFSLQGFTRTPTRTTAPTLTPTLFPTQTPTAAFDFSLACVGTALAPRITPGMRAWVLPVPPQPNTLRGAAGLSQTRLGSIAPGEEFDVLDGPVCADNMNWYQVRLNNGQVGWTSEGGSGYYWLGPVGVESNLPASSSSTADSSICPGAPPTFFTVGETVQVDFNRSTGALPFTSTPDGSGGDADIIGEATDNQRLLILGGPVCGTSGDRWRWYVRNLNTGLEGWASEGNPSDKWMCPLANPECGF